MPGRPNTGEYRPISQLLSQHTLGDLLGLVLNESRILSFLTDVAVASTLKPATQLR